MSAVPCFESGRIRPMTSDDLMAVMEIERRCYPHPWTAGIMRDCLRVGYSCWVYERDQVIQAYAILSVAAGEAHLLNLCVRPEVRSQGVGRRLLQHVIITAGRLGGDTLFLEVRPSNKPALALYEKLDFSEVGLRRAYYPGHQGREDAIVMARPLN
ncbi:acetyltransferases [Thiohalobacter thiocyanaticus]|uniref:[Ribosomal protein bS18]-alanine N-acetyltransferase n=1 Tax=Thiohalobacter thiocyanaticus TaxID=585455 RepID=A0A1Z4VTK4_9GAMM|nr:ribosomal protein S18-alanine N-acetyltransferase [Thiohalobacter thiocyanaticus]BAZ94966.1 acetyltransferases [Thiohalobacter thiocyanaticus]